MKVTPQTKITFTLKVEKTGQVISQVKTLQELGYGSNLESQGVTLEDLVYQLNDDLGEWQQDQITSDWEAEGNDN